MKSSLIIVFCCVFSALAQDENLPATLAPGEEFFPSTKPEPSSSQTTPAPLTPASNTTTSATTGPPPSTTSATTGPPPSTTSATTGPPPSTTGHLSTTPNATTGHIPITNNDTTTPAPSTNTTTPAPSTTAPPKPTPPNPLSAGDYHLMKGKAICLMARMAVQIRLVKPKDSGTFTVQPNKTRAVGECQENRANLTLVFQEGFITFIFNKSTGENSAYANALLFSLVYPLSTAGGHYAASNQSLRAFPTKIGHSYSCRSESIYMGNGLYLDVKDDRIQAFNLTKSEEFGVTDHCAADQPDYRVAIGVGVTLLILILVVIAVYLLGRKRRTDGYQSL
ncbi:lysosome-associated membrane glycoprotein 3-like [Syngnathoides biaculeatus]|uniref:lysosome-associated membrane glycoprotein 3-like n=1 Tax=Syngnathoides biaculeatus TaxID=300417 RepID=UPI002ADE56E0|nr:lysosome-associated membrane glycoprotein 3-like [Syngnathoides biaculeatus]